MNLCVWIKRVDMTPVSNSDTPAHQKKQNSRQSTTDHNTSKQSRQIKRGYLPSAAAGYVFVRAGVCLYSCQAAYEMSNKNAPDTPPATSDNTDTCTHSQINHTALHETQTAKYHQIKKKTHKKKH